MYNLEEIITYHLIIPFFKKKLKNANHFKGNARV